MSRYLLTTSEPLSHECKTSLQGAGDGVKRAREGACKPRHGSEEVRHL